MNKPVAWYKKDSNDYLIENIGQPDFQVQEFIDAGYIPLYTHPIKELTQNIMNIYRLSDQSIQIVFTSCRSASEFEAILRKAQEK